jgi:putative drug exporter of the RND superfamily
MRNIARFPCGRWTKWAVLGAWLVVFVVAGPLAGELKGVEKNDPADALPKNAESTRVVELAKQFTPTDTVPALVVYERRGAASAADQAKVAGDVRRYAGIDNIGGQVVGPILAKGGTAFQVVVPIRAGDKGSEAIVSAVEQIRAIARDGDGTSSLRVYVTGPAGYEAAFDDVFKGIDSSLLYITAAIVIVILLLTYRSPVLWLVPLVCVIVALTAAQAVIYLLARDAGLVVNDLSATTLTVLVFGAGTDYALLLIARYREELRRHADRHAAMAEALHRAGPAITASAATVALSLLCFLVAELSSSKSVGPVTAIGIAMGLGVMLTLLPALLVVFGRWMFWPVRPTLGSPEPTGRGVWARIGARIARRPRLVWLVTAVVLGAVAFGMTGLRTNDLQLKDSFRTRPEAVTGEQALARHFPAGAGSPVQVIGRSAAAPQLQAALAATPGVTAISAPVTRDGFSYVEGTLTSSPDSQASFATVDRLRSRVHAIAGADGLVGGGSAINLDTQRAARHDRNLVMPLVLVVVFVILAVLLRALVAPLLLVGTVVLSFAAALGVSTLVFDHVFHFAGSFPAFPLYAFVFLVALGVDYNIFLMTRVHEESRRHGTRRGALIGLAATGGVITSAGLVLAGTFMALGSLPVVLAAEMGFVVAFGVLLDTFVVRSVLVTALALDVGRRLWWPSGLYRRPDLDLDELEDDRVAALVP